MKVIFCNSVLDPKKVDPLYEREFAAARSAGFGLGLLSHEALVDEQDVPQALSRIPIAEKPSRAIYRGWMMREEAYQLLYEALREKNLELINDPLAYGEGHLFPRSFELIQAKSPRSVIIPKEDMRDPAVIQAALASLTGGAIVKDYVKSLKHHWEEACYIPDLRDEKQANQVINRFIELQGESLVGGLVLREYVALNKLTEHSQSGMPLSEEYRIFWVNGQIMQVLPYWEEGVYQAAPKLDPAILAIGKQVGSKFFTMDIAKTAEGEWIIMELGDGQVAGLPEQTDVEMFYQKLRELCVG